MFQSYANRDRQPEWMDEPGLDSQSHQQALAGLARINRFTGSDSILWPDIRNESKVVQKPLRVLDVATGAGDILIRLADRARKEGIPIEFAGCDISQTAIDYAQKQTRRSGVPIQWFQRDALRETLPNDYDILLCSLFLHHLENEDACALLKKMGEATQRMLLVNDLCRSRFNYFLVWLGCRLLTRSPIVHLDGPLSVRAAFTRQEVSNLASQAGLFGTEVMPRFPCRFLLRWRKSI